MKFIACVFVVVLVDTAAYLSVPQCVRYENRWSITPFVGGTMLGIAYHFGNKLKPCAMNSPSL